MSFRLKLRKIGAIPVLVVIGDITGKNIGKMTVKLEGLLKLDTDKIVVDLSQVTFVDSHGLGVFVFFFRRLSEQSRELVFLNPSEFIADLFFGSNLSKVFTIVDNEDML